MIIERIKDAVCYLSFYLSTLITWALGNHVHLHAMDFKKILDYTGAVFSSLGMIIGFTYSSLLLYVLIRDKVLKKKDK